MESAAFVLLLAATVLGGFVLALRGASAQALLGVGLLVPLAVFVAAFLTADQEPGRCTDCGQYLGRYWEPWLVAFGAVLYAAAYWGAFLVGRGIRRRTRRR